MHRSVLLMLAAAGVEVLPRSGKTKLGFAEVSVDNATGELEVDTKTLRPSLDDGSVGSVGDDYDGDDDVGDEDIGDEDDLGDEDDVGDEDVGEDVEGEEDVGEDDLGDEDDVGANRRRRGGRRVKRDIFGNKTREQLVEENRRLRRANKKNAKKARAAEKGKLVDKTVTEVGETATSAGQAMTMTITPKSTFMLEKIYASGDSAVLTSMFAGEVPIVIDPIDTTLLTASAFRGPSFRGKKIQAGVPITVNYTAGGTTAPLRLTLTGKGRQRSC